MDEQKLRLRKKERFWDLVFYIGAPLLVLAIMFLMDLARTFLGKQ